MTPLVLMGESLRINAQLYRDKLAARDLSRAMTFHQWNERACRLANALLGIGLRKGDRVAILAFNCIEWLEFYAATAKAGLIMVPINFRLLSAEIAFIVEDCEAKAFIVQSDLLDRVEQVREQLSVPSGNYIHFGGGPAPSGYKAYEDLIGAASAQEPSIQISPEDIWALMYTSGTTGRPKGAMRSHGSQALTNLVTLADMEFSRNDTCLLAMPMCHANSLFFACTFAYAGASCVIYNSKSFDPEHFLRALSEQNATFTSLVPTQYIMMLSLPEAVRAKHNVDCVSKLLISSAPAREDTKRAIMEAFRNSRLMELYGSTEQGWATLLRPDEQITKLGSIGREYTGSGRINILDESGNEVPDGEAGELYSRTPWCFDGYWKMPEKTAEAFRGPYLTVGDMARRDEQGYYFLVDRKSNMIISGGENVYPSEIENALGAHPKIKDVAVIGLAHAKWGESVHAVIVLQDGASATEDEIIAWCADRMAGYKRPRSASFITLDDMPRTATGKILHRVLRERLKNKG